MGDPEPTYIDDMIAADRELEREWNKRCETSMTDPAPEGARSLREIEARAVEEAQAAYDHAQVVWTPYDPMTGAARALLASLRRDGCFEGARGPQPFDTETEDSP